MASGRFAEVAPRCKVARYQPDDRWRFVLPVRCLILESA